LNLTSPASIISMVALGSPIFIPAEIAGLYLCVV
jgi:hypothetical protein